MKTKFFIDSEVDWVTGTDRFTFLRKIQSKYSPDGYTIDEENQRIYYVVDKEIKLNEGDLVYLHTLKKVTRKVHNIIDDTIEYDLDDC